MTFQMRNIVWLFIITFNTVIASSFQDEVFNKRIDVLFQHTIIDGHINTDSLVLYQSELNRLVKDVARADINSLEDDRQLAVLLNAYHLFVLQNVLREHGKTHLTQIDGFMNDHNHLIMRKAYSLNNLRNEIILKKFKDKRLYFAFSHGTVGDRFFYNRAFTADSMSHQLNSITKAKLNDEQYIRYKTNSEMILIPELFKWYGDDFANEQHILQFINTYRDAEDQLKGSFEISIYPHSWKFAKV